MTFLKLFSKNSNKRIRVPHMRLFFADIHFASAMHTSPELSVIIIPYGKTLVNASVKAPASAPV